MLGEDLLLLGLARLAKTPHQHGAVSGNQAVIIRQLSETHFISSSSDGVIIRLMLNKFKACFQSCFLTQFSALVLNPLHNSRFLDKFDLFSVLKSCSVNIV